MWLVKAGYCQETLIKEKMRKDVGNVEHLTDMLTVKEVARLCSISTPTSEQAGATTTE
jgi:hypothetical protein